MKKRFYHSALRYPNYFVPKLASVVADCCSPYAAGLAEEREREGEKERFSQRYRYFFFLLNNFAKQLII